MVGVVEVAVALGVLFFDPPATAAIMMTRTTTPTPSPIQRPVRFFFGGVWDGGNPADPAGGGVYVGTPTGAAGDGGGGNGGAPGARCGGYHLPSDAIHQPTPCEVSLIVRPNLSALAERSALSEHNYRRDASWELGDAVQILEPFHMALARPQLHPCPAHLAPAYPPHRLETVGRRTLSVAVVPADHPPALARLGPDGVGVVRSHGSRVSARCANGLFNPKQKDRDGLVAPKALPMPLDEPEATGWPSPKGKTLRAVGTTRQNNGHPHHECSAYRHLGCARVRQACLA